MNTKPLCVIVAGRPGSGKTTLAKKLSASMHLPMLSRDEFKEGFVTTFGVRHDKLPSDTNRNVTDFFFSATQSFLEAKISVVIEAAFQHAVWAEAIPRWSPLAKTCFILCNVNPDTAAQRHLQRGLDDPTREFFHGDNRVKVFRETGQVLGPGNFEPPKFNFPTLSVDTTHDYAPPLDAIIKFIQQATTATD